MASRNNSLKTIMYIENQVDDIRSRNNQQETQNVGEYKVVSRFNYLDSVTTSSGGCDGDAFQWPGQQQASLVKSGKKMT